MKLIELLSPDAIIPELQNTTKEGVIEEICKVMSEVWPECDLEKITSALLAREKLGSTGIEYGVAIPHAKISSIKNIRIAVGKSTPGIEFQAHDGKPSHLFFVLLAPDSSAGIHLKTLARLSRLLKDENVRVRLLEASSNDALYDIIRTEDEKLPC